MILVQFVNEVMVGLVVHAELLAYFTSCGFQMGFFSFFLFEFDSHSVVAWVANPSSALWRLHHIFHKYYHVFGLSAYCPFGE